MCVSRAGEAGDGGVESLLFFLKRKIYIRNLFLGVFKACNFLLFNCRLMSSSRQAPPSHPCLSSSLVHWSQSCSVLRKEAPPSLAGAPGSQNLALTAPSWVRQWRLQLLSAGVPALGDLAFRFSHLFWQPLWGWLERYGVNLAQGMAPKSYGGLPGGFPQPGTCWC